MLNNFCRGCDCSTNVTMECISHGCCPGPKGDTGDRGPAGPRGPQGEPGQRGPRGFQGERGAQGRQGCQGAPGPRGTTGLMGPEGPAGVRGDQGPKGDPGCMGPQGVKGNTGDQGPAGPAGPRGPVGDVGATGPQGIQGEVGAQGPVGPVGPMGPAGPQGEIGPMGPQGLQGDMGCIGPEGPEGAPGPAGAMGPVGPAGETPYIGTNGNWWIGTVDTGVVANIADILTINPVTGTWMIGSVDTGVAATGPQGPPGPAFAPVYGTVSGQFVGETATIPFASNLTFTMIYNALGTSLVNGGLQVNQAGHYYVQYQLHVEPNQSVRFAAGLETSTTFPVTQSIMTTGSDYGTITAGGIVYLNADAIVTIHNFSASAVTLGAPSFLFGSLTVFKLSD